MANNIFFGLEVSTAGVKSKLDSVSKSMTTLGRNTKTSSSKFSSFYSQMKKTNSGFQNMNRDANRASVSVVRLGNTFSKLKFAMAGINFYMISRGLSEAISGAMDMVEVGNLFAVAMGDATEASSDFVANMSEITGLDTTNAKSAVGTFAMLSRSMGINSENSRVLSENMYKLGLDLSSLVNVPIDQVMRDLRSGLVGQSETVYKYGLDVTEASLKAEALAQGITKSVRNMSQGEKMALRYSVMIKKSSLAHGDLAKTIEQPANQLRILRERIVTLSRSIGTIFMPAVSNILPYLNALASVLIDASNAIAKLFGYQGFEASGALTEIGENASIASDEVDGLAASMKTATMGIDELNVISPTEATDTTGVESGNPNVGSFEGYDNFLDIIDSKSKIIAEQMKADFSEIFDSEFINGMIADFESLGNAVSETFEIIYNDFIQPFTEFFLKEISPVLFPLVTAGIDILNASLEILGPSIEETGNWIWEHLSPAIEWLTEKLEELSNTLSENKEDLTFLTTMMMKIGIVLGVLFVLGKLLSFLSPIFLFLAKFLPIITFLFKVFGAVLAFLATPIGGLVLLIAGIITIGVLLYKHWDEVKAFAKALWEDLKKGFGDLWENIKTTTSELWDKIVKWLTEKWDGIKETVSVLWEELKLAFTSLWEDIKRITSDVWESITSVITEQIEAIKAFIDGFIDKVTEAIRKVKEFFTKKSEYDESSIPTNYGTGGYTTVVSEPGFAQGGILDAGMRFIAGEGGKAELIGSYQNKTTVMPLQDSGFVEAMYKAVYSAVSSAQGSGGQVIENVVQLDGNVIYKNQQEVVRNRGKDFGLGVFAR